MRIPRSGCWALFNFAHEPRGEVLIQCNAKAESVFLRFHSEIPSRLFFADIPKPVKVRGWLRIGYAGRTCWNFCEVGLDSAVAGAAYCEWTKGVPL